MVYPRNSYQTREPIYLMLKICKLTGIKKIYTMAYHPQTERLVKNFN